MKKDPDQAYIELLKVELNHPGSRETTQARRLMARISGHVLPPEPEITETKAPPEPESVPQVKKGSPSPPKPVTAEQATITAIRYWSNPTYSRVAIDLNQQIDFREHLLRPNPELNKPMRIYLDLKSTRVSPDVPEEVPIADGLLKRARVGQYDHKTVRVVLDVNHINNYRIFSLSDPFRIVIDVSGDQKKPLTVASSESKPDPATPKPEEPKTSKPLVDLRDTAKKRNKLPRGQAKAPPDQNSLAHQLGLGVRRIVIDPGHGGKDNGATGVSGLHEKDLTLRVARILAAKIKKKLKLDVLLTRSKDVFLTLEERTATANTNTADLFISIHANALDNSKVHGIETYFLNVATDKEAMRVAALENATTTKKMSDLETILNDLMLNSKIAESGRLADKVHRSMVNSVRKRYKGIRDLKVKQAPFYVLIGANMPSILVELGFITNVTEEKRLKSDRYMNYLTDGIVAGIKAYINATKKKG